jgi:16S rRNA (adenine1518-N6/adenine1519-N6)-dimethyltransferase
MTHPSKILRELEQRARRRFGQHFLTDPGLVARIVRGGRVTAGDRVIEIGPGLGILTQALLDVGAEVTAVELDRDLAGYIRGAYPQVNLIEADAAAVDWEAVAPGSGWKVVANLPYNVGTKVLMQVLRCPRTFSSATVMLQREVVNRLMADKGSRTYGALSVEAQVRGMPVFVMSVPPGAFHPPPKVHSAVLRFDLFAEPETGPVQPSAFDRVVRGAFSQRRKTILNSLGSRFGKERVRDALTAADIDSQLRAEHLGIDDFRRLAEKLVARDVSGDGRE